MDGYEKDEPTLSDFFSIQIYLRNTENEVVAKRG